MLNYRTLEYKPEIVKNDVRYLDLLQQTMNFDMPVNAQPLIVNKYYVARPDLIALAVYGDDRYGDTICKLNGISNPFELNENMLIFLPNVEYLNECMLTDIEKSELVSNVYSDSYAHSAGSLSNKNSRKLALTRN